MTRKQLLYFILFVVCILAWATAPEPGPITDAERDGWEKKRVEDSIYDSKHTIKGWFVNKALDAKDYVDSVEKARKEQK